MIWANKMYNILLLDEEGKVMMSKVDQKGITIARTHLMRGGEENNKERKIYRNVNEEEEEEEEVLNRQVGIL